MNKLKILMTYDYDNTPLSCGNMLEAAFRRRDDVEVYRTYGIKPEEADVCFNTLAKSPTGYPKGKLTAWWDIEACSYLFTEEFDRSDIILAPYSYKLGSYPQGKTFFFPFATDPKQWYHIAKDIQYDIAFVGREDPSRQQRINTLNWLAEALKKTTFRFLRTNGINRGPDMSELLSTTRLALQISGDFGHVMETRFFEIGPITLLAADRVPENQDDLDWAAIPDVHYIPYTDNESLLANIHSILEEPKDYDFMRKMAFENYQKNHTYDVRVRQFLEQIEFLKGPGLDDFHEPRRKWIDWAHE